jgi:acetoin utilization protein AcuB
MVVVQEIMTRNPYAIEANQSVREALHRLLSLDIRHLPVLDNGVLVGMLSDRDVRGIASATLTGEASDQLSAAVSDLMTRDPISVDPEADIGEVIDLMIENKVGALPVVAEDKLIGIVSYVDVLRYARAELEE